MKLYWFPPDRTRARARRVRFLIVALLAATAWGVVSVRQANMGLADYRTATAELLEEMPYLIAAGRAVAGGMLRAAVPKDVTPAVTPPPSATGAPAGDSDDAA
jgi:hypothetical protein